MKLFVDSNIFIAIVTDDTDRSDIARKLLNSDHEFYSSIYNVMEVRNVLATKYHFKRDRIEEVERTIRTYADPVAHNSLLVQKADEIQEETYTTAMDAIMLAGADSIRGTLVTFDTELHAHGAKPPEEISI
ncbi:type II toxin-antitoxin system VapC family toxin [Halorubrum sp. Atlit-26R]|uniref:type II toxin-antitoxin system VapC family toxin n=1 Tax=Halorubrum sp. Atlit-26R TaxID=2282128 RepID=UPI000EF1DB77|nr:PIN domain-containing protein [Halorubrum sp. Atlit-26R]RLM60134.1 type II toxin-antitoxin system VapC family toxin [Halorubrum sp. Atlit-26R]